MLVPCAVGGCRTSIRPVPCAVPSFHRLQQAEWPGLTAWAAFNTQWSHEGSLSLTLISPCPLALREKAATSASSAFTPHWILGARSGANLQSIRQENRRWRWGGFPETLHSPSREGGEKCSFYYRGYLVINFFSLSLWPTVALRKVDFFSPAIHEVFIIATSRNSVSKNIFRS